MSNSTEITKVQVIIRRFLWETRDVVNDSESSRRWLENFRNTLQFQDLNDNPEPYALALLSEAREFNKQQLRKQQTRWVRESLKKDGITSPTKEQIETRWAELYGNENPEETQVAEATAPSAGGSCATNEARESQRRAGADSVRGTPLHSAPARSRAKNSRCPNSREEFHAFVADNNLHEGLAEEWYAIHEAREWVDKNGNPIKDWRGALYNYCTKTEQKRRTA